MIRINKRDYRYSRISVNLISNNLVKAVIAEQHHWKITLLEKWPQLIGELGPYVSIDVIKEQMLLLKTTHPVWTQEVTFILPELKEKIAHLIGNEKIVAIKINSGSIKKSFKKNKEKKNNVKPVISDRTLTILEQCQLAKIPDVELRKALERFLLLSTPSIKESTL